MSLFDKTNQAKTAFDNSAAYFPATMGESMSSAYDEIVNNETSIAFQRVQYEMFESYRDQIEELTGDRLYNPLDYVEGFGDEADIPGDPETPLEDWFDEVGGLREKYPAIPQFTHDRLMQDIVAERQKFRDQRAEVASRETSFGNTIAGFVGAAGGILTDPLILGSMAFGAPAATTVLRAALIEGAVGAGSEVLVQGVVQATRSRLGEGVDFERAATNILLAGVGGGILAGTIRGGISGTKALLRRTRELPSALRTPKVKAAETYLTRKVEMEDTNPFGPSVAGQVEHARRLDQAMLGLVRPFREALKDGTAIGRALPTERTLPDIAPIRPSETIDQYVARVRQKNVDVFRELDANTQRISDVDARVNQIDEELAGIPRGNEADAIRLEQARRGVADLQGQKQTKAVKERLAKAEKMVQKLEARPEVGQAVKRNALVNERATLVSEGKELGKAAKGLAKDVKRAVKKTKRRDGPTAAPTKAAIDASDLDASTAKFSRFMADLGEEAANATESLVPLSRNSPQRFPVRDVLDIDPEIEKVVKDEGLIDAELQKAAEDDPDKLYIVEDPDTGAIREMTASQVLDDLAEDKKLLDEFKKCITEALP